MALVDAEGSWLLGTGVLHRVNLLKAKYVGTDVNKELDISYLALGWVPEVMVVDVTLGLGRRQHVGCPGVDPMIILLCISCNHIIK